MIDLFLFCFVLMFFLTIHLTSYVTKVPFINLTDHISPVDVGSGKIDKVINTSHLSQNCLDDLDSNFFSFRYLSVAMEVQQEG